MGTQQFLFFSFTHVGDLKLLVLWIDMDAATVESEIFFANGLVEGCGQLIETPFNRKHLTRHFFLVGTLRQFGRSEEHTSELQSRPHLVCRLLLEKKKKHHTPELHLSHHVIVDQMHVKRTGCY